MRQINALILRDSKIVLHIDPLKTVENHVENVEKFFHPPLDWGIFPVENSKTPLCKTENGHENRRFALDSFFAICYNTSVI